MAEKHGPLAWGSRGQVELALRSSPNAEAVDPPEAPGGSTATTRPATTLGVLEATSRVR